MNDLQTLRAALTQDEPSRDVVDRSRHRLRNRIQGGRRAMPRRTVWLAAGATVTAAAAAVTIVVVPSEPAAPGGGQSASTTEKKTDTGQEKTVTGPEILLAAATAAEQEPAGSGTYWHVTITTDRPKGDEYEYWTKPNGEWWLRSLKTGGEVMAMALYDPMPFGLVGAELTLEQLRALPTDPEALKAFIATAIENGAGMTSAGPLKDVPELFEQAKFDSLLSLVSTLPAPPAVRATAFRAIATYPGVENLGPVPGGQGLLLPDDVRFVVDPATGRVNGTSRYITSDGGQYTVGEGDTAKIVAEWTDTLPS